MMAFLFPDDVVNLTDVEAVLLGLAIVVVPVTVMHLLGMVWDWWWFSERGMCEHGVAGGLACQGCRAEAAEEHDRQMGDFIDWSVRFPLDAEGEAGDAA